tara:strand:+ start:80 stop:394 length:315 start_codon:yes stop_codon:yes gene_type:complete
MGATFKKVITEGNTYWKQGVIARINGGGLCATSKTEKIGEDDLYFFEGEVKIGNPPKGASRLVSVSIWFRDLTTKVNDIILVECEPIVNTSMYRILDPLKIKLK